MERRAQPKKRYLSASYVTSGAVFYGTLLFLIARIFSLFQLFGDAYTRNKLEQARRDFHVGNLYLNRQCTGALVGIQPFGGFNMSGTDSKAGGADYLLLFLQAKSVTEKL